MSVVPWVAAASAVLAVMLLVAFCIETGVRALARHRESATRSVHASLLDLFLFLDPQLLYLAAIVLSLAAMLSMLMATHSIVVALACGAATALLPTAVLHHLRLRRRKLLQNQFPDMLLMLAGALRAGSSLSTAMQQIGAELPVPMSQEVAIVLREQRLGVSLDSSLENFSNRIQLPSVALAVAAMRIAYDSGGGLAEALERSAFTLRNQLAIESKIRALTSQGKMQAVIVGLLPVLLLLVLLHLEPAEMSLLFLTRAGVATLLVMAVLEILGVHVIRRIVSIDV